MKLLIPLLIFLIFSAVWLFRPTAENQAAAEQESIPLSADLEQFMIRTLTAIEKNDLNQLVRMTWQPDEFTLETYQQGIFASRNFCPAKITGARRLKKNSRNITSILVNSEPRNQTYQFSLIPVKGGYAIQSISPVSP